MRGLVPGLVPSHPVGDTLPAMYAEDDFALRLVAALDEVGAPIQATLDGFTAYLDPALAPEDVLDWLATWVGVEPDLTWPVARRRALVASAAELYRSRGTAAGLAAQVAILTEGEVEIDESGAAGFSAVADAAIPGEAQPSLVVRVKVPDPGSLDKARLEALVMAAKPAHVPHTIEVRKG